MHQHWKFKQDSHATEWVINNIPAGATGPVITRVIDDEGYIIDPKSQEMADGVIILSFGVNAVAGTAYGDYYLEGNAMHYNQEDESNNHMEITNMGSINPNDVATLSLLGNGHGYGYGRGHYHHTREPYDGTVANANIERNAADMATQGDFSRDIVREENARTREQLRSDAHAAAMEALRNQNTEFHIQTQRDLADARAETAKCCCETKEKIAEEADRTRALINANLVADLERQLSDAKNTNQHDALAQQMAMQTQLLQQILLSNSGGGNGPGNSGK